MDAYGQASVFDAKTARNAKFWGGPGMYFIFAVPVNASY